MTGNRPEKIVAIIPAHNNVDDTLACLDSLSDSTFPVHRMIVVDDGSDDGTSEVVSMAHPDVLVVKGDGNMWWAGSVNAGLREAMKDSPDFYLLLNQDNLVEPDTTLALVESARERPESIVGSVVVDKDDPSEVGFCGGIFEWSFRTWRMFRWEPGEFPEEIETETMTGMGTLLPAAVVENVGLMDTSLFPHYWSDSDYAMRARAAGHRVFIEPRSRVLNRVASTGHVKIATSWRFMTGLKRLWDIRSPFDMRTTAAFYRRHCPHRATIPARLALCYSSLAFYEVAGNTPLMGLARKLLPKS